MDIKVLNISCSQSFLFDQVTIITHILTQDHSLIAKSCFSALERKKAELDRMPQTVTSLNTQQIKYASLFFILFLSFLFSWI